MTQDSTAASSNTVTRNSLAINTIDTRSMSDPGTITAECLIVNQDIMLNQQSLAQRLAKIEQRLNIIHHNQELEQRWAELKQLGDRYRQLETELVEKEKMWNILKSP